MRIWAEVYDSSGAKVGKSQINDIISTKIKRELDSAGSFDFNVATSKNALELLTNEREVRVFFKRDDYTPTRELYRGYIRQNRMTVNKAPDMQISGVTKMDALARRSVLLGRAYDAAAVQDIASDLIELVPGWNIEVDADIAGDLQTARFDGSSVLKALIRVAEEKGVHIREGVRADTVEIGAFGVSNGLRFIKPPSSIGIELASNNEVVLVGKITQTENTEGVVNWIIPLGAGEGSAAMSLKDSTRTSPYAIQTMTAPNGATLYYLSDDNSILEYGQIERVVTFKEIAPIANSSSAKIAAANALYDAAAAWLQRNSVKLTTYKLTGCKVAQTIRPGDKIRIVYKGTVDTIDGKFTYIDINDDFWVMSVTENFSKAGLSVDLDVTTIDRHAQDGVRIVVGMMDAIEVRNLSVQTYPAPIYYSSWDTVQWGTNTYHQKRARFRFVLAEEFTDIAKLRLQFRTRPLSSTTTFDHYTGAAPHDTFLGSMAFQVRESTNYPQNIRLFINDVDVTSELGGPWATSNSEVDVTVDIHDYITEASGGLYQSHTIEFECGEETGQDFVHIVVSPTSTVNISHGYIECSIRGIGNSRAIL